MGWEGSLTQETGKTLVKRGNRFDMTSIVRGHAPGPQEPPLCPVHSIGRGGRVLLELAVFTEASGEKSEVSADLFSQYLENLAVGKSATHWFLPTSYLDQTNLVSGRR